MNTKKSCIEDGAAIHPLVSVVMPCYNHEIYVERAVLSVLNQTYPRIQLVVIDDGSRDGSVRKLELLQKKYGFTLLTQENKGVCKTLNRGVREVAQGEFVALLASDDFWSLNKIQLQVEALQQSHDSELCFSQAIEFMDEDQPDIGRIFPKKCLSGNVLRNVFIRQHVPAGTLMFSRRLYDELGGFDESLKEEDWDFVIRSAAVTEFTSVEQPLLYYRSHQGNTMKTRKRALIFQEKAKILSKNMHLVGVWRWLMSLSLHFSYDILYSAVRKR